MAELVNANPVNETHANVKRTRSTFPLKQMVLDTHRFGEIHPHLVIDGITSDKLPFRSTHTARSYTLKAPLMQDIQMHKDYFMIPLRAILPMQADRIVTNPTIGDDVPSDSYTNVTGFVAKIKALSDVYSTWLATENAKDSPNVSRMNTIFLKWVVLLESVFSNGSLLASLGCNLSDTLVLYESDGTLRSYDYFVDAVFTKLAQSIPADSSLDVSGLNGTQVVVSRSGRYVAGDILLRDFIQQIRDDSSWFFGAFTSVNLYDYFLGNSESALFQDFQFVVDPALDIDLARLWAYHLVVAEYYSNDKVDYIYSSELFRQYIHSLHLKMGLTNYFGYIFDWNGNKLSYDFLAAACFNKMIERVSYILSLDSDTDATNAYQQYFLTLFGYHRSLRYKDYFTGSRTRPLAVGDTSIPVVGGNVSVIDVSRNIQIQRFLNAVNATGRKFGEYLKGIFGVAPSPDRHNPIFLAHTSDGIFASEVENTAEAQQNQENSVTSVFRGNSNKFAFEVDVDEPMIILGVTCYDIERAYSHGIERSFFTKDRYDMFLPQLQYVGDQPVYRAELSARGGIQAFGYQFRDMDRKQLVNRAVGGFAADVLPGFAFIFEPSKLGVSVSPSISPDFIRSRNIELDEFYLSLTHYSLGTYFHFIVLNNNLCNASRPMAYNPQILG